MPGAHATVVIGASPADVCAVITDFANYPEFVPDVAQAVVLRTVPGDTPEWTVRFSLRVVRPIGYTLRLWAEPVHPDGTRVVRWSLVEGSVLRANEGSWTLSPCAEGTTVLYEVSVELALYVPSSLTRLLAGTNLPLMLTAFKDRLEA